MDKLSEKLTRDTLAFSSMPSDYIKSYIPEIEKLEKENEDLIDDMIRLIKSHDELLKLHFGRHSGIIYAQNASKAFKTIQQLTGKSWEQISKEQE